MTPETFQAAVTTWAASVTTAIGVIAYAIVKLAPAIKSAKDAIENIHDQNHSQQEQITRIALATPVQLTPTETKLP